MAIGASMIGLLVILIVLVLPMAAGITMIVLSRRGGLGYPACGACRYNLSATVGTVDRCPECGAMFVDAGITPPRGKRRPAWLWVGIALIVLPTSCAGFGIWSITQTATQSLQRARAAAAQAKQQALAAQQAQQQATGASDEADEPTDPPPDSAPQDSTDGSEAAPESE